MRKLYILLIAFIVTNRGSAQNCAFICNGDFENPMISASTVGLYTTLSCWNTTATDGKMELWSNGYNGVPSYSNNQHVELNATQAATMYQDFNITTPGIQLTLRFAHRARTTAGLTDTMAVEIGPASGPYTSLGKFGDGPSAWGYYQVQYFVPAPGLYRVRFIPTYYSYGNAGVGNFLDAVSVCLEQPTGVVNFLDDQNLKVYPNPSSNQMNFIFENDAHDNYTLNVYDIQGRIVKTVENINSNSVQLEKNELKGIYFYELSSGDKNYKGKLSFVD